MRSFKINGNDAGQRLDKFISKVTEGLPKSLLYKDIRKKKIKINGKRAHENDMLAEGDVVDAYLPDEFFPGEKSAEDYQRDYSRMKTVPEIIYEDGNIILCNKKPGVLVHLGDEGDRENAPGAERETLVYALTAYLANKGEYSPADENSFRPALCNRIDRNTGGIVIMAKNAEALRCVTEGIREKTVGKTYLAAVHGRLAGKGVLEAWHTKNSRTNTVAVHDTEVRGSRKIITGYESLSYSPEHDLTLVRVDLVTGRTHQIRAHMAHIGHPLLGDGKYGRNADDRKAGYTYQALWSCSVRFSFDGGPLSYLDGRRFYAGAGSIPFLSLFPDFSYADFAGSNDPEN